MAIGRIGGPSHLDMSLATLGARISTPLVRENIYAVQIGISCVTITGSINVNLKKWT